MFDLPNLPFVFQTPGKAADQAIASLRRLQQDGATIGTALALIELHHRWIAKQLGEQQTLCRALF